MFQLAKWYLDCVTDAGDAAVLYWACLRWGMVRLHYGAALIRPRDGDPVDRYTLRPGSQPEVGEAGELQWECERLDVAGIWLRQASGVERTLIDGSQGSVQWHCVTPRADATVRSGGRTLRGTGYVEHLTMTLKPWRLPFNELRWGRFISPSHVLVWIDWRGSVPGTWVFANDVERRRATIAQNSVELPDDGLALAFDDGRVLRSGPLADTALHSLRAVVALLPRWRDARETKWLSRGTLTDPNVTSAGWVVHEVVRWR